MTKPLNMKQSGQDQITNRGRQGVVIGVIGCLNISKKNKDSKEKGKLRKCYVLETKPQGIRSPCGASNDSREEKDQ